MKNTDFISKHFLKKIWYLFLVGLLVCIFSIPYLIITLNLNDYIELLYILAFIYMTMVIFIILIGVFRRRSVLNLNIIKRFLIITYSVACICMIVFGASVYFSFNTKPTQDFSLATPFFSEKKVMILIPHQDDDINLAGGIMEQYIQNGSKVYVVFSTNGDYNNLAETRCREAIDVLTNIGVCKKDIYFLGYGDQWQAQEQNSQLIQHMYNSMDEYCLWTSANNRTQTYGTQAKECYKKSDYTRENFSSDLKNIILEKMPDIIYCTDYDQHIDHKALDLFFEEVMGQILCENTQYKPVVYKGFCYGTAWDAPDDFTSSINLLSSKMPDQKTWDNTGVGYQWNNRVRIPMSKDNLSRMISNTNVYKALDGYVTANAYMQADNVLNGDKVFWERRTDSLLYNAKFYVGEESVHSWNDFKLKDSVNIAKYKAPRDGVRSFDSVNVVLKETTNIDVVGLYDNPDPSQNILGGYILFDDGSEIEFGPLEAIGDVTYIPFDRKNTSQFSIYITETEGDFAGLTEIEAYDGDSYSTRNTEFVMAVDGADNFVYDYWLPSGESAEFTLYAYPSSNVLDLNQVSITLDGDPLCSYEIKDDKLVVLCPKGQQTKITITYNNLSVTFSVSNPYTITRLLTSYMQIVNKHYVYTIGQLRGFYVGLCMRFQNSQ